MKIGIDARLIEETGVGRYIRNLISELGTLDGENRYIVFIRRKSFDSFKPPNNRWEKRLAEVPWHSITEQFVMPWLLIKEHLDLFHVPYFNVPIFYPGKYVVTIHDLTILHFDTGKATTLPLPIYKLRRLGYLIGLSVGLTRATKILAVSQATKKEIIDHFGIDSNKIQVTYEGVDSFKTTKPRIIKDPYFLYVGNAYPHKNLEILLRAFRVIKTKLVLVGKDDFFYKRLPRLPNLIFFGQANDEQLASLYAHAAALVFPSLMEGFGLPALEALSLGCPVVCSDIPVFHEILGDHATYFDPNDPSDIASKLMSVNKVTDHRDLLQKYSWRTMAEKTLKEYLR